LENKADNTRRRGRNKPKPSYTADELQRCQALSYDQFSLAFCIPLDTVKKYVKTGILAVSRIFGDKHPRINLIKFWKDFNDGKLDEAYLENQDLKEVLGDLKERGL